MKEAQKVKLWAIRHRPTRPSPWEVRWIVDGNPFSLSHATKALAENYRADLHKAMKNGETFATVKPGEPLSWARSEATLYELVRDYVALRWEDGSSANTRQVLLDGLVPLVLSFLHGSRKLTVGRPEDVVLRTALRRWGLRPPSWGTEPPAEMAEALAWIERASRPVGELGEPHAIRAVLAAMSLRLDGKPLQPSSVKTRRSVLHGALDYITLERKCLEANPLTGIRLKRARTSDRVDPRKVPNRAKARALLAALASARLPRDRHLHAFFAVLYYAGTRPAEARGIRKADLILPEHGWGTIMLGGSLPESGDCTDSGERFEVRELKHRAAGAVRPVPIPPVLVTILREHLDLYGTAPDGRLFWGNPAHEPVRGHVYTAAWARARKAALTAEEQETTLAKRPYDLRHGNASYLLAVAGVPSAEVARRLGHSVAMLHTTYAHYLEGQEDAANALIDAATLVDDALTSTNSNHGPQAGQQDEKAAA